MGCVSLNSLIAGALHGGVLGLLTPGRNPRSLSPKKFGGRVHSHIDPNDFKMSPNAVKITIGAIITAPLVIGALLASRVQKEIERQNIYYDYATKFQKYLESEFFKNRGNIDKALDDVCNKWGYDRSVVEKVFSAQIEYIKNSNFDDATASLLRDERTRERYLRDIEDAIERDRLSRLHNLRLYWDAFYGDNKLENIRPRPLRGRVFRDRSAYKYLKRYKDLRFVARSYKQNSWKWSKRWQNDAQRFYDDTNNRTFSYKHSFDFRSNFRRAAWRSGYSAAVFDAENQNFSDAIFRLLWMDSAAGCSISGVTECGVSVIWSK